MMQVQDRKGFFQQVENVQLYYDVVAPEEVKR